MLEKNEYQIIVFNDSITWKNHRMLIYKTVIIIFIEIRYLSYELVPMKSPKSWDFGE
ncbi:hypothetical protein [Chryseobacterium sp. MYb328]|uniref:hypothetical protein n=1 Tax=Chryseobacterium sp. MYb328 TaxID=2745231 RepID=UPI0030B59554